MSDLPYIPKPVLKRQIAIDPDARQITSCTCKDLPRPKVVIAKFTSSKKDDHGSANYK